MRPSRGTSFQVRALEKRDLALQVPGIWIRRSQARKVVSTPKNKRARFHVIPRALAEELQKFMLRTADQLLFPDLVLPFPESATIPDN